MLPRFLQPSSAIVGFFVPTSAPHFSYSLRSLHFSSHFLGLSSSTSGANVQQQHRQEEHGHGVSSKLGPVKSGLYLVATPIGNLEDITLRALRILKSADLILSEDTRHSRKLLLYYGITTPLLSYHKFNESERERSILQKLRLGEVIALISDAGTPCISDPGMELAKVCVKENIPVVPIPGPSALVCALSACGLSTDEFKFVGFLSKHARTRREKLKVSAADTATQIFFVPPHKLHQFLEEASLIFGDARSCVIAREMTKIHEEFWRGTLGEANKICSTQQPKGEITLLIEGKMASDENELTDDQLELELKELISKGHSLSVNQAIKSSSGSLSYLL
ncbi:ribosomal RNA small subunit methyltransferase I-like isoform X2 [Zingiber officinale]|uniref:ribosomal RNA small subunit methyltransferase I-like isoform X2 n=1 Tax=Zingiber officinale TaxID=94328 RepID=UPI001C4DD4A0|nr:ribosomal RNA small subunit methyltransferase I-like isoform X2 [Zingiber officinale]XP_042393262.1 ribosomal RNA small subunit methyltransferase I-like isoform X2 [Zingiber officinale]